jgi:hypothetical protein
MEHPCSKCGSPVTDGVPFCPHCKAPQIRVPGFDAEAQATSAPISGEHEVSYGSRTTAPPPPPQLGVLWHQALPAAAIGGVVSITTLFLTSGMPLVALGPAYAFGGAVAVFIYVYRARLQSAIITVADGAKIGAASGGFAFLVIAIIAVGMYVYHVDFYRNPLSEQIGRMTAQGYDPQVLERLQAAIKTDQGLILLIVVGLTMIWAVFITAATIGGALCASWLRRR